MLGAVIAIGLLLAWWFLGAQSALLGLAVVALVASAFCLTRAKLPPESRIVPLSFRGTELLAGPFLTCSQVRKLNG